MNTLRVFVSELLLKSFYEEKKKFFGSLSIFHKSNIIFYIKWLINAYPRVGMDPEFQVKGGWSIRKKKNSK